MRSSSSMVSANPAQRTSKQVTSFPPLSRVFTVPTVCWFLLVFILAVFFFFFKSKKDSQQHPCWKASQNRDPPHLSHVVLRGCRVRAGPYLEDQRHKSKTPGRTDKNICKGHSWNLSGPQARAGNPNLACQQQVHRCPAHLVPSPDQSPGCPAWEEVINYITSSMLLLSKGQCGTDRYQHVPRAIDFVYGFVHWLRKIYSNTISSHCPRESSRALKYDFKSTQGTWWNLVTDEMLVLTLSLSEFLKGTILELRHNGICRRYVLKKTPPETYAALFQCRKSLWLLH